MSLDLPLTQRERVAALVKASQDTQTRADAIRATLEWFPSVQPHVVEPVIEAWATLPPEPMVGDAVFELMRSRQVTKSLREALAAALVVHHHPRLAPAVARWITSNGLAGWPTTLKRFGSVSFLLQPGADQPLAPPRETKSDESEEAFIERIVANPEDDDVRHVFADWLSERGHVQGEFISLQLKASKTKLSAPEKAREKELLLAHRAELMGPFAKHVQSTGLRFSRGFISVMRPKHVPHHPLTRLVEHLNAVVWQPRDPEPVAFDSLRVVERLTKVNLLKVTTLAPRLIDLELDGYDPFIGWERDLAAVQRSVPTLRLTRFLNLPEALTQLAKSRLLEACSTLHITADSAPAPAVVDLVPPHIGVVVLDDGADTYRLRG